MNRNTLVITTLSIVGMIVFLAAAYFFTSGGGQDNTEYPDLKIIKNNSEENITNYLLSLKKILSDSARDLPKNLYNNSDELSLLTIQQLRNTYGGAILKIYNISVPEKALDIHKEEIALLSTKKNIFEKILAYETDPLTAIIAVNELKNTDAEFQKLSNRVAKFIKDYNLSI